MGGPWPVGAQCANPAPARHPNGSVAMACHSNGLTIWTADSGLGPFREVARILNNSFPAGGVQVNGFDGSPVLSVWEDPFLWIDQRGHWHLVCHTIPRGHPYNNIVSGHAFSTDGIAWTFAATQPWDATVAHQGGETVTYATRERPSLLFEDGRPTALYTGVVPYGGPNGKGETGLTDWSFTLMQPIASGAHVDAV